MRLTEYVYAITKSSSKAYGYDIDDEADVKLYQLSKSNHKLIIELLTE